MSMQWLMRRAPGFSNLSEEERSAIVNFALLWTLFEARVLNSSGSANRIVAVVNSWHNNGALDPNAYRQELAYFRQRYFANGDVTHHFYGLQLRGNDRPDLVRAVLDGTNNNPSDCIAAIFIIVLRFRNNLFHGIKWEYELADQLENFSNANGVLMKALERHGQLGA